MPRVPYVREMKPEEIAIQMDDELIVRLVISMAANHDIAPSVIWKRAAEIVKFRPSDNTKETL